MFPEMPHTDATDVAAIRLAVLAKCWTSSGDSARPKNTLFAVGEPLLEDLAAAELVAPEGGGGVAPEGVAVQVDVKRGLAESGKPRRTAA